MKKRFVYRLSLVAAMVLFPLSLEAKTCRLSTQFISPADSPSKVSVDDGHRSASYGSVSVWSLNEGGYVFIDDVTGDEIGRMPGLHGSTQYGNSDYVAFDSDEDGGLVYVLDAATRSLYEYQPRSTGYYLEGGFARESLDNGDTIYTHLETGTQFKFKNNAWPRMVSRNLLAVTDDDNMMKVSWLDSAKNWHTGTFPQDYQPEYYDSDKGQIYFLHRRSATKFDRLNEDEKVNYLMQTYLVPSSQSGLDFNGFKTFLYTYDTKRQTWTVADVRNELSDIEVFPNQELVSISSPGDTVETKRLYSLDVLSQVAHQGLKALASAEVLFETKASGISLSPKGRWIMVSNYDHTSGTSSLTITDRVSKMSHVLEGLSGWLEKKFSHDEKQALLASDSGAVLLDTKSGEAYQLPRSFDYNFDSLGVTSAEAMFHTPIRTKVVCDGDKVIPNIVEMNPSDGAGSIMCTSDKTLAEVLGEDVGHSLGDYVSALSQPQALASPLSQDQWLKWQAVMASSPKTAMNLKRVAKADWQADFNASWANRCPKLSQRVKEMVTPIIEEYIKGSENPWFRGYYRDLEVLKLLRPVFATMGKSEREDMIDKLTTALAQSASQDPDFKNVFYSKLYYFVTDAISYLVKGTHANKSDLAIINKKGQAIPIILSGSAIDGDESTRNFYGFYSRVKDPVSFSEEETGAQKDRSFAWSNDLGKWQADVDLTKTGNLADLIPREESFDYQAIKKDGVWAGMVAIGSNHYDASKKDKSLSHYMAKYYRWYFQGRGYKFSPATPVFNFAGYMEMKIESGELDWLFKEAHSDGDDRNLFRVLRFAQVEVGEKTDENGIVHRVYIARPLEMDWHQGQDSDLIANQDFGSWIRDRAANGKAPLIYFNGSCSSYSKVLNEVTAAQSSGLLPIPSVSTVWTFTRTSTSRYMLDGFFAEKSFDEIREMMKKSEKFKDGYDKYAFPDDEKYDEYIRKNLADTFDAKLTLINPQGQVTNIDVQNEH